MSFFLIFFPSHFFLLLTFFLFHFLRSKQSLNVKGGRCELWEMVRIKLQVVVAV